MSAEREVLDSLQERLRAYADEYAMGWLHEAAYQMDALKQERDEARRFYCRMIAKFAPVSGGETALDVARMCQWDCFEKGGAK